MKIYILILVVVILILLKVQESKEFINKINNSDDKLVTSIPNFLSRNDINNLLEIAEKEKFSRSTVMDDKTGKDVLNNQRTSMTTMLQDYEDRPVIKHIKKKASLFAGVPVENIESLQVVRYYKDQKYNPHFDYFKENTVINGEQRVATFFVYLNDKFDGGYTEFPNINKKFKGKKGEAFFWWNTIDKKKDERTLHGGMPVLKGKKYGLNIWLRNKKI